MRFSGKEFLTLVVCAHMGLLDLSAQSVGYSSPPPNPPDSNSGSTTGSDIFPQFRKSKFSPVKTNIPPAHTSVYGKLPLSFEPNQGQTDRRVKFTAKVSGYTLFVTASEAVFAGGDGSVERMHLIGASPKARFEALDRQPGISNYFIGNDPSKWRTNIPNYGRVALRDVYPGIDLIFYGNERQLEYDWVIAPGADPKQIRVKWEGADRLRQDIGDLILSTALSQRKPAILQEGKPIAGGYVVHRNEVGFKVAKYDVTKPLIIDPVFVYSTYLGGNSSDFGCGIAVDSASNAYVVGSTASTNFPVVNPLQGINGGGFNVFVTKINPAGTALVYSTYLGGNGGTSGDSGNAIALDGSGNAYITGITYSTNFPTVGPLQASYGGGGDAFVAKINATGSALAYSTYLGGSGQDCGYGIAVASSGEAHVTGCTNSPNFPTSSPLQGAFGGGSYDAFVAKINAAGSALVYSTYLGGNGDDQGMGISVDGAGSVYVAGSTASTNFPTFSPLASNNSGGYDAFITKINAAGSAFVYSTYLGGTKDDSSASVALDSAGNAYITGPTSSTNFPTNNPLQASYGGGISNAFVAKINTTGSALVYSTYLGGSGLDDGTDIAVDGAGNAYVVGFTGSSNFPTSNPLQAAFGVVPTTHSLPRSMPLGRPSCTPPTWAASRTILVGLLR